MNQITVPTSFLEEFRSILKSKWNTLSTAIQSIKKINTRRYKKNRIRK